MFKLWFIYYHTQKLKKIKIEPRIKLNHNIYTSLMFFEDYWRELTNIITQAPGPNCTKHYQAKIHWWRMCTAAGGCDIARVEVLPVSHPANKLFCALIWCVMTKFRVGPCFYNVRKILFIIKLIMLFKVVTSTFEAVDEILKCDHSNESCWAVLSCDDAGYYAIQDGSNFWVCAWNPKVWLFKRKLLSSTFLWCSLLCCTRWFLLLGLLMNR